MQRPQISRGEIPHHQPPAAQRQHQGRIIGMPGLGWHLRRGEGGGLSHEGLSGPQEAINGDATPSVPALPMTGTLRLALPSATKGGHNPVSHVK